MSIHCKAEEPLLTQPADHLATAQPQCSFQLADKHDYKKEIYF